MFLVLDLFESAPEVAPAPKPEAAPSIDLFGTGKAKAPFLYVSLPRCFHEKALCPPLW